MDINRQNSTDISPSRCSKLALLLMRRLPHPLTRSFPRHFSGVRSTPTSSLQLIQCLCPFLSRKGFTILMQQFNWQDFTTRFYRSTCIFQTLCERGAGQVLYTFTLSAHRSSANTTTLLFLKLFANIVPHITSIILRNDYRCDSDSPWTTMLRKSYDGQMALLSPDYTSPSSWTTNMMHVRLGDYAVIAESTMIGVTNCWWIRLYLLTCIERMGSR